MSSLPLLTSQVSLRRLIGNMCIQQFSKTNLYFLFRAVYVTKPFIFVFFSLMLVGNIMTKYEPKELQYHSFPHQRCSH